MKNHHQPKNCQKTNTFYFDSTSGHVGNAGFSKTKLSMVLTKNDRDNPLKITK